MDMKEREGRGGEKKGTGRREEGSEDEGEGRKMRKELMKDGVGECVRKEEKEKRRGGTERGRDGKQEGQY